MKALLSCFLLGTLPVAAAPAVLHTDDAKPYIDTFNQNDTESFADVEAFPNAQAWDFLKGNIPLFDCPDESTKEVYYFRWWTYRKHIKKTPDGFVVTEYLPNVKWAGKFNTINCAAGHHIYEGRWLRDPVYMDDYIHFWLRKGGELRKYSFWIADAVWQRTCVTADFAQATDLLPNLISNYGAWKDHQAPNGLYWQSDDRDGMEASIGGNGFRPTINSDMYGDAMAIAAIADQAGKPDVAKTFRDKAAQLKQLVQGKLWNADDGFFEVLHGAKAPGQSPTLAGVRELHGYTPWYFNLPDADKSVAWKQLMDPQGFSAPFGPITVEQRNPAYAISYKGHECQWNGPSWPFATSRTLTAMANLLDNYRQDAASLANYFDLLQIYTKSQHRTLEDGRAVPWIDEDLNPTNGDWIVRSRLTTPNNGIWDVQKQGGERGKDYNHSTYCDLVITGLIGLRPRADDTVEVKPLVPPGTWDYFCLDDVAYHGHTLTILYDRSGQHYGHGAGLQILSDGKTIASSPTLGPLTGKL